MFDFSKAFKSIPCHTLPNWCVATGMKGTSPVRAAPRLTSGNLEKLTLCLKLISFAVDDLELAIK